MESTKGFLRMNRKILSILSCSASCFFAAEHGDENRFDRCDDPEVAYYTRSNVTVPYCDQAKTPFKDKGVNTLTPRQGKKESDAGIQENAPAVDAFLLMNTQALHHIASGNIEGALSVYDNAMIYPCTTKQQIERCKREKTTIIQQYIGALYKQDIHAATQFLNAHVAFKTLTVAQQTSILCDVSKSLSQQGKVHEAFHAINFAIKLEVKKCTLQLQLIDMLKGHQDYANALLQYEHSLKTCKMSDSQAFFAHMDMAKIHYEQYKNPEMAKKSLESASGLYRKVAKCQQLKYDALEILMNQ